MRIYYDCEFVEDGRTIAPVSIGMVAEDGRRLYRIFRSSIVVDRLLRDDWLRANVASQLPVRYQWDGTRWVWEWDYEHPDYTLVQDPALIKIHVRNLIQETPYPQLWSWYGAYDHVMLAQLWGRMSDLPTGVPMWTNDLQQEIARLGVSPSDVGCPSQDSGQHNAMWDAEYHARLGGYLRDYRRSQAVYAQVDTPVTPW